MLHFVFRIIVHKHLLQKIDTGMQEISVGSVNKRVCLEKDCGHRTVTLSDVT